MITPFPSLLSFEDAIVSSRSALCFGQSFALLPPSRLPGTSITGGEGQYTQWVHCELIVGSETIHPAHTQGVNSGHIQKVPTHLPSPNPAGK